MSYIKIYKKTDEDISFLKSIEEKLKPFLSLVDKSKYPISVTVVKKKDKNDLSHLDLDNSKILLKYNSQLQSKEDIIFVLVHEIFHWISLYNDELKKVAFTDEIQYLEKALQKVYPKNDGHDLLPYEVVANFMAALITGKFHKRHFFNKQKLQENIMKKIQIKQSNLHKYIREQVKRILSESDNISAKWSNLSIEKREELLQTVFKDTKNVEKYIHHDWDMLPTVAKTNIERKLINK